MPDPADLPAAISARIADSGLIASVAGDGFVVGEAWYGTAPDDPGDYYIAFIDPTFGFTSTSGLPYVKTHTFQFHCFAPTARDSRRLADGLVDLFGTASAPMTFADGRTSGSWPMAGGQDWAEYQNENGVKLRRCYVGVRFATERTYPS